MEFIGLLISIIGFCSLFSLTNLILLIIKEKLFLRKSPKEGAIIHHVGNKMNKYGIDTCFTILDMDYFDIEKNQKVNQHGLSIKQLKAMLDFDEALIDYGISYIYIADKEGKHLYVRLHNKEYTYGKVELTRYR